MESIHRCTSSSHSGRVPRPTPGVAIAIGVFLALVLHQPCRAADSPKPGEAAPDFSLAYATADTVVFKGPSLQDEAKNGPIVLAFYPADWSPGCTKEVCTLRDSFDELGKLKVTVWAISGDNVFSHKAWAEHHHLPFRLLSDPKHEVAKAYGVFNDDSGFNRRTVFVVGKDGRIVYTDLQYSVADQTSFEALKSALGKTG